MPSSVDLSVSTNYRLAQPDISEIGYPYSGHYPPCFQIHFVTILYSITIRLFLYIRAEGLCTPRLLCTYLKELWIC